MRRRSSIPVSLKTFLLLSMIVVGLLGCPPRQTPNYRTPVTSPPAQPSPTKQPGPGWVEWNSDAWGFRMLIPRNFQMKAAALGNWGGFHGSVHPVDLYGLGWLNHYPALPVMQAFAIKRIGIPGNKWTLIGQGQNKKGWKWFKTYRAVKGKKFAYAILGHGPRGAYILYLTTTPANRLIFNARYVKWYNSVTLY